MAKFSLNPFLSRKSTVHGTVNHAGGRAFVETAKLELASLLLTTFLEDEFYRTEKQTIERIRELIGKVGNPRFVAQSALYARNSYGMRSVSHLVAGEIAQRVKGERWTKRFYSQIVRRPDDVVEILGYYLATHGRPIPNSLKKGLGSALGGFNEYQLSKYRRDHATFKLVDAVNLVRPRATPGLTKLMRGELAPAPTWETKLTKAGEAETVEQATAAKSGAWAELVRTRQLGYLALLRNVRNILTHAPEVVDELGAQLTNQHAIRVSLVFPFQYVSALEALEKGNLPGAAKVLDALNCAVDLALANVTQFPGKTLVALDTSGSMNGRPRTMGSLFAAILVKAGGADLLVFSNDAQYVSLNPQDSTLTLAKNIPFAAAGTNFNAIFERANCAYDRIVILSDMQSWVGGGAPVQALAKYERSFQVQPRVFSFDLQGYGTLQFPQERVYCLAGWSERVFDLMHKLDRDPAALVREIEALPLD